MAEYIKLFNNHTEYAAYKASQEFIRPNVSNCINENEVHYSPIVPETRLIVTYNVSDASNPTQLYFYDTETPAIGVDMFDKVEIDGTEVSVSSLDANSGTYDLSSGEHTVAYTLKDPTIIGEIFDESTGIYNGGAVFAGCAVITNVQIPNSVTSIGDNAFENCASLANITIPNSVTSIGNGAFFYCSGLRGVTIGDGVTSIGDNAFQGCSSLTSVTIGDSVTSIGYRAFKECSSLTSVTIPNSVTSIGDYAFCGCSLDATSKTAIEAINPNATICDSWD